ncbi:hypothetical protein LZ198_00845 [Myxococcus sp. K15C18031901]|uniref:hypothetical protein n=1 Tax=Myxococcus dinghuensis TaxID=2906761 RepID=UPI0020A80EF9|nr:hypothetical protein [Myxococcus dinghuensis]MCP3097413.1 hypothetical protein [Myxococcus dinghuensis]
MINPVHLYVWQAAIVGNARLGGQELRALMLDDPDVASNYPSHDVFRGFAWDGNFEPSFYAWVELQRQRGLKAVRALRAMDPADWVLTTPPPPQPRLPELALVFEDSVVWYRHAYSPLRSESPTGPFEERFEPVPGESRPATLVPLEVAERELLAATRDYVAFVEPRARGDESTDLFYAAMGRFSLDLLQDTEAGFQRRFAALREAELKEYRRRARAWHPVQPATRAMRPIFLANAAKWLERDDYLRVMEAAGASWRAVRLARASQDIMPLSMRNEWTSEEELPPFTHASGYVEVARRWSFAAADAFNAALNAR